MNTSTRRPSALLVFTFCSLLVLSACGRQINGFDLSNATIDGDEILSGGPPRDGIPSIDHPKFLPVADVDFLQPDDIVIGLQDGSVSRAYPLRILVWHEIVNDTINGHPVAVTYCPLCGTSMVFERTLRGTTRTFGVSGLLWRSDVLMYDRETESLWSQLAMKAISGPSVDLALTWLPSAHLTWSAWKEQNPNGRVLSTDTGHQRDYARDAYAAYFASEETMFPVPKTRAELSNKSWVIGVLINGAAQAYPVDVFPAGGVLKDSVSGTDIVVRYDPERRYPRVHGSEGEPIPSVLVFWFAWQAFYPDTGLWSP